MSCGIRAAASNCVKIAPQVWINKRAARDGHGVTKEVIMGNSKKAVLAVLLGLVAARASEARAAYVIDLDQVGSNVVATGRGSFNTYGIDIVSIDRTFGARIDSSLGILGIGNLDEGSWGVVYSPISGPLSFGSGADAPATSTSGDITGIFGGSHILVLPLGYGVYGPTILSGTATWDNTTLAALGVSRGSYVWTWGSGGDADSFTLNVSGGAPESSTWAMMLAGFAGLGFATYRASRKKRRPRKAGSPFRLAQFH
jgi:hypothetical protein